MSRQERDGAFAFVGANWPSIELVYCLILDDLHDLFQEEERGETIDEVNAPPAVAPEHAAVLRAVMSSVQ